MNEYTCNNWAISSNIDCLRYKFTATFNHKFCFAKLDIFHHPHTWYTLETIEFCLLSPQPTLDTKWNFVYVSLVISKCEEFKNSNSLVICHENSNHHSILIYWMTKSTNSRRNQSKTIIFFFASAFNNPINWEIKHQQALLLG